MSKTDHKIKINLKENLIIVEGNDDKKFIEAYLESLDITSIQAHSIGGKDNKLQSVGGHIAQLFNRGRKVAMIFDANSNYEKSKKNTEKRLKEDIEERIKKEVDKSIRGGRSIVEMVDIFLFPNNEGNGSLENLLEELTKHKNIICCFREYKKCIEGLGYPPPDKKAKIYAYQLALGEKGKKAKEADEFKSENWDFEHKEVQPLKKFLTKFAG